MDSLASRRISISRTTQPKFCRRHCRPKRSSTLFSKQKTLFLLLISGITILQIQVVSVYSLFVLPDKATTIIQPFPKLKLAIVDELNNNLQNENNNNNNNNNDNIIQYEGVSYEPKELQFGDLTSHKTLDVKFMTPISKQTFDLLQYKYCNSWSKTKSQVEYFKDKLYKLTDFLPPLLQATNGLKFKSTSYRTPLPSFLPTNDDNFDFMFDDNEDQQGNDDVRYKNQWVLLTCNCWGFAWDVLVQADNDHNNNINKNYESPAFTISCGNQKSVGDAFLGSRFDLIQDLRTLEPNILFDDDDPNQVLLRNKALKPGDILLIWENDNDDQGDHHKLTHVAIYIDDDLYYEKSGGGDNLPFRLSTLEMIRTNFPISISSSSSSSSSSDSSSSSVWEWRRLLRTAATTTTTTANNDDKNNNNNERLKSAQEIFSVNDVKEDTEKYAAATAAEKNNDAFSGVKMSTRRKISIDIDYENDNNEKAVVVKSQLYTGILSLEGMEYEYNEHQNDNNGRASLPKSAFSKVWYGESFLFD
jgi:hypothetical protein